MSASVGFHLPPSAEARLDTLVDSIEANPGPLLNPAEMRAASDNLNVHAAIEQLPEGITEEDFVGVLRLAMLTECATDSYSAVFQEGAEQFNAPWLGRFNERIWTPDEHTHHTPYKYMLQSLGYSEEELDLTMHEVRERHYEHCCGRTPVELTTYGIIQEYLTDNWHGMISQLLKPSAPYAAKCASMVKRRETLHTTWYREMTAIQVEENPEIMGLVADTVLSFQMPGTQLVPELGRAVAGMDEQGERGLLPRHTGLRTPLSAGRGHHEARRPAVRGPRGEARYEDRPRAADRSPGDARQDRRAGLRTHRRGGAGQVRPPAANQHEPDRADQPAAPDVRGVPLPHARHDYAAHRHNRHHR